MTKILWDKFFCIFGFPERIYSNQGPSFESEQFAEFRKSSGIRKSHTLSYHPMGNGSAECFNRTLGISTRAMTPEVKLNWPKHLSTLTFMYNFTIHETTGYAPFYLMYGRVPCLPVDILSWRSMTQPNMTNM